MTLKLTIAASATALMLCAPFAFAQSTDPTQSDTSAQLNTAMTDTDFLNTAASSDEFERQSGQIAVQRGQREDVRTLGQQLITDHTQSTAQLTAAASAAGLPPPTPVLHPGLQRKLAELTNAPAEVFDQIFLQIQAEAHADARGLMRTCIDTCDAEPLRTTADQILPVIRMHLAHTIGLQRSFE
ncbi:MAG: DUF4142 domain-containing protein [Povalibacter sp.]|jgi:putative membrane protein